MSESSNEKFLEASKEAYLNALKEGDKEVMANVIKTLTYFGFSKEVNELQNHE